MIVLYVERGVAARALSAIKLTAADHPGAHHLVLSVGRRRLSLGPTWGCDDSEACLSALAEFGLVELVPLVG